MDELLDRANAVIAIQKNDRDAFGMYCDKLFGKPAYTKKMLEEELKHRKEQAPKTKDSDEIIDAKQMEKFVEEIFNAYNMKGCSAAVKDVPSFRIKRGRTHHSRLIIPKTFSTSRRRVVELLTHEIEVHLLRSENALATPLLILKQGLDHYLRTEEGLGMYYSRQVEARGEGRTPGFWNAYAIELASNNSFTDAFEKLFEAKKAVLDRNRHEDFESHAKESAWKLCVRAYRGIANPSEPGPVFTRDHIYLSGYLDIKKFMETQKEDLPILFAGKMAIDHIPMLKKLGLEGAQTPKLVSKELVTAAFQNRAKAN